MSTMSIQTSIGIPMGSCYRIFGATEHISESACSSQISMTTITSSFQPASLLRLIALWLKRDLLRRKLWLKRRLWS